ncbi:MAG: exodeoxyribonuclease V subunit alpha [Mariprofundales bacterium]|nr:exodeoxyribonuclease V subunit alpha [Mariprofundales bacterium]
MTLSSSPLAAQFSRFIGRHSESGADGLVASTAKLLVVCQQRGDSCLDLQDWGGKPWPESVAMGVIPDVAAWVAALRASDCVALVGSRAPMVLDGSKLYLFRYWRDEQSVAQAILARLQQRPSLHVAQLQQGLQRLFPSPDDGVNWQRLAAALAVSRGFAVISGGPGTGKTTSLIKLLSLLLEQGDLRIALAAPTGKAAARMVESIRQSRQGLDLSASLEDGALGEAFTIHRLLGYSPRGWRHDANNPLALDCLVVDEASMVSLPLMARLVRALPQYCRLILLGDRDQLASVEAGSVLGDITGHGDALAYDPEVAQTLAAWTGDDVAQIPTRVDAPPIANAIALLRTSYRFGAESGIGRLAGLVNRGASDGAIALLRGGGVPDLHWHCDGLGGLLDQVADRYAEYLAQSGVASALAAFERMRVLCAVRQGKVGVEGVNAAIASRLQARNLLATGALVHGTPVMVTVNSYELGLFNGDVGLVWRDERARLRVWFRHSDQSLHQIPLQLLPRHDLAWAMTVHQAQGSEFDQVVMVLPQQLGEHTPVSRELLYTAITRTRHHFTIFADLSMLRQSIQQRVQRSSGLATALGWGA